MNHLMQDANTYTKGLIRTEFLERMNDVDFDACTNKVHVNEKFYNVKHTLDKLLKFLGRPHHPDKGGDKETFIEYKTVHRELLDRFKGEAAVCCAIKEILIETITSVVNDVAWDQKMAENLERFNNAQQLPDRLISTLLVTDDEPIPETALVAQTSNTAFTVPEAAPPDTSSLPPNTVALSIFENIVTAFSTLKVPMNGDKEYVQSTITSKKIKPIRMLLQNQLVPIPSDEPDFWTILDMVDKQNIPKSTHLHKKLPSAIDFFRELRELNPSLQCTDDVLPDALCDTTVSPPVTETIESDATPMSSLQVDAPDTPPAQEDVTSTPVQNVPLPDAPPQPATETKRLSRKNRAATMKVNRPQKRKKSSNTETAPNDNAFFDAMWERVLLKLMPKKKSVADYIKMAKRCTNGEETTFPPVQTVDDLLNACLMLKGNTFHGITSASQRNRIKKVIIVVTDHVERVGFDAARDYFQNGAETAHPVSCA